MGEFIQFQAHFVKCKTKYVKVDVVNNGQSLFHFFFFFATIAKHRFLYKQSHHSAPFSSLYFTQTPAIGQDCVFTIQKVLHDAANDWRKNNHEERLSIYHLSALAAIALPLAVPINNINI